ncbi:MAG: nucleoside triphosphate pyrophosphatase [Planctomycetota bacterium]
MPREESMILASGSAIRARLLRDAGLRFEVQPADIDEEACRLEDPGARARELALGKARAIAARHPERLVLGSDQVFTLDGRFVPKPVDRASLIAKLRSLSGRTHVFHCGLALVRGSEVLLDVVDRAEVSIHELGEAEIAAYADTGEGIGCAGGYRLEEGGVRLIREVRGSHFTVLGLPMLELVAALRRLGLQEALYRRPEGDPR